MPLHTVVVLTGGPQGGKSTLLRRLRDDPELGELLTVVPEAAAMLFLGGHPMPGPSWTDTTWRALQYAITSVQISLEEALAGRTPLTVCDRAPFDNLAYHCGHDALELLWGQGYATQMKRYDLVVHMESLAIAEPELFGGLGSEARYETVEEAKAQEVRTRAAWEPHHNRHVLNARLPFEEKLLEATNLIKDHLHGVLREQEGA